MPEISEKELAAASKQLWLKALTAVQISNHTYAISLLQGILGDNPGFLEARKLLRKCELQLAGGAKKKSGLFGIQTGGMGLMKIQGVAKKDPLAALTAMGEVGDPVYATADVTVEVGAGAHAQAVEAILEALEAYWAREGVQ